MHSLNDVQSRQVAMGDLSIEKAARNHTDDIPARIECRISENSHQPDARSAINDPQVPLRQLACQFFGRSSITFHRCFPRTKIHAD